MHQPLGQLHVQCQTSLFLVRTLVSKCNNTSSSIIFLCESAVKKLCRFYDGVGRVVGALSCEAGFASSMLNKVIFHDARASLRQKTEAAIMWLNKKICIYLGFTKRIFMLVLRMELAWRKVIDNRLYG